jgi:hypothetical protein
MKVVPIPSPLPGERVLATSPAMRPDTDARWRQRIHYWAGRSLTAEALELDQENRAARMAWLGRLMTPGIVSGLEVALEEPAPRPDPLSLEGHFVHVAPGVALTASGEDVVVPRALRVPLSSIPVEYVRVARTPEFPAGEERPPGAEVPPDDAPPRRLDLGTFAFEMDRFPAGHIPWAAALVLRPAELRAFGQLDPDDPCELDPSRDAFADERRIDAAQLVLCQFPVPWEALPDLAATATASAAGSARRRPMGHGPARGRTSAARADGWSESEPAVAGPFERGVSMGASWRAHRPVQRRAGCRRRGTALLPRSRGRGANRGKGAVAIKAGHAGRDG